MPRRIALLLIACCTMPVPAASQVIVLIGGDAPHNPNVHDARQGIERLGRALATSPDVRGSGIVVRAFPDGWPADPAALTDAATVVLYFDGLERHPLLDPDRRAALARLMARGVGLVAFHQAFTLPPADRSVPLADWLGAARYGMVDRTVEHVSLTPERHPVTSGVRRFAYRDEFYPTLSFAPRGVTPILRTKLRLEAAPSLPPTVRTVSWAYVRPGGGRSFGFSGFHYLDTLDRPDLRKLMLNAILWTARVKIPAGGIRSTASWKDDRR